MQSENKRLPFINKKLENAENVKHCYKNHVEVYRC